MNAKFLNYEIEPEVIGITLTVPNLHDGSLASLVLEGKTIILEFETSSDLVAIHALDVLTAEFLSMPTQMIVGQVKIWPHANKDALKEEVMTLPMRTEFGNDPLHYYDTLTSNGKTITIQKVIGITGVQLTIACATLKFYKSKTERAIKSNLADPAREDEIVDFIKDLYKNNPDIQNFDKERFASKVAAEFKNRAKKSPKEH